MSSSSGLLSRLAICFLVLTFLSSSFAPALAATFPVTNADVSASQIGGAGEGSSVTDSSGNYVINSGIGAGNYNVTASSYGFMDQILGAIINATTDTKTLNFQLSRSAIIQGYVKGYDGKAVKGAEVELDNNVTGDYIDSGLTDSNGFYYFATNVPTGTYTVAVSFYFPFEYTASGLIYGGTFTTYSIPSLDAPYLPQGYLSGSSAPISATAGQVTTASDIILAQSGIITGVLKDPSGNPLSNAAVYAEGQGSSSFIGLTDSSGTYRISYDIFADTYTVTGYAPGIVGTPAQVSAAPGSTSTLNLASSAAATVKGTILRNGDSKPISGASVDVYSSDYSYYGFATTGADGSYKITEPLGAGSYSLQVFLGSTPVNSTTFTLSAGQNLVYNALVDAYFITGTVRANSTSGPALQGAGVRLSFGSYGALPGGSTYTAQDGTYQLVAPIMTGTKGMAMTGNFTASDSGYTTVSLNQSVTIGTDLANVNFVLTKAPVGPGVSATITGSVSGSSGPNLPPSTQWWHVNDTNNLFDIGLNTSSAVSYVFTSIAGKSVQVYATGPEGTSDTMSIWIPKAIFQGPFTVTSTPGPNPTVVSTGGNTTYTMLTITFSHSSKLLTFISSSAIPEFPGFMLLAALGSSVAVVLLAERRLRSPTYLQA